MVFQGENIPLTEDVLKKKEEFVKTWGEFQGSDGEQIIIADEISGSGTSTFFNVPANNTLFITNAWITATGSGTNSLSGIQLSTHSSSKIVAVRTKLINATEAATQNFNMPLKVEAGAGVVLASGLATTTNGGFSGFLISKRLSG